MKITSTFEAVLRHIECKEYWVYFGADDFYLERYKKGDIYKLCDDCFGWNIVSMQMVDGERIFVIEVVA